MWEAVFQVQYLDWLSSAQLCKQALLSLTSSWAFLVALNDIELNKTNKLTVCVFGKVYCPVELNAAQSVCMLHTWVALFFLLFSSDVGIIFHENFFSHQWNYLLHIILFNAIKLFSPLVAATALDDNVGHFSTNAVSTLSIVKINQPFIFGKKPSIIWFSIYVWVAAHIFSQEFVFLLFWPHYFVPYIFGKYSYAGWHVLDKSENRIRAPMS